MKNYIFKVGPWSIHGSEFHEAKSILTNGRNTAKVEKIDIWVSEKSWWNRAKSIWFFLNHYPLVNMSSKTDMRNSFSWVIQGEITKENHSKYKKKLFNEREVRNR